MACLVQGCAEPARNKLAIRCRKPNTLNVWSPDSDAYLCKKHAEAGIDLVVTISPNNSGEVSVTYLSGGQEVSNRTTPIQKSAA